MSEKEQKNAMPKGWVDSIAERTKYDRKDVLAFIKKYKIPQTPGSGNPKRIHIVSLSFTGKKQGKYNDDINFSFSGLKPGVWGLFSDGNGKGKSSAIEIMKWLFKGKPSEGLQSGVKSWIKSAELQFKIDEILYGISVQQDDEVFIGEIKRSITSKKEGFTVFKIFNSEDEMGTVVAEFMLDQLELGQFSSFRQGTSDLDVGGEVVHGWPALAAAMFIGTSYGAIFGDVASSGLPNRILNMYMGLPWIPTYSVLKTLSGQLKSIATVENQHLDRTLQDRKRRLKEIQDTLTEKEKAFDKLHPPKANSTEYYKLEEEYNKTYEQCNAAYRRLIAAQNTFAEIEASYKKDQISLTNFKEDRAANKIFKQLNPTCCPHCEQKISFQQIEREKNEHVCAVCDRSMLEGDDSDALLAELQEKSQATTKAYNEHKNLLKLRRKAHEELTHLLVEQKDGLDTYRAKLDKEKNEEAKYLALKNEISKLRILEEEYKTASGVELDSIGTQITSLENQEVAQVDEAKILTAALKETEARFKGLQEDLLQDVNRKMMEYCNDVGLSQYKELSLSSQPSLKITKDGGETSFSKGEQLRLKVLATIALISVAEERRLGRHPGFLVIDSPAAHEVNEEDLNNLIGGLKSLRAHLPSLQIIVASVANKTLLNHVDEEHRKYAKGNEFLW